MLKGLYGRRQALIELTIQYAVCVVCNTTWSQIAGRDQKQNVVTARQLYCYLSRRYFPGRTAQDVADVLGKSLCSVMDYNADFRSLLEVSDAYLTGHLNKLEQLLNDEVEALGQPVQKLVQPSKMGAGELAA